MMKINDKYVDRCSLVFDFWVIDFLVRKIILKNFITYLHIVSNHLDMLCIYQSLLSYETQSSNPEHRSRYPESFRAGTIDTRSALSHYRSYSFGGTYNTSY